MTELRLPPASDGCHYKRDVTGLWHVSYPDALYWIPLSDYVTRRLHARGLPLWRVLQESQMAASATLARGLA